APGHPPTRAGGSVADLAAAYLAFGAIGAALVHRLRTGEGQHLDVSLLAATLGLLPDPVAHYFDSRVRPERVGNRNPTLTPAEAFRTGDGWLNVVLMSPEQWDRFCRVLGDEVLRTEPRFATNADRLAHHAEMKARIEAALAGASTAEWVARFAAASIAAGPASRARRRDAPARVRGPRRRRAHAGLPVPGRRRVPRPAPAGAGARGAHRGGAGGGPRPRGRGRRGAGRGGRGRLRAAGVMAPGRAAGVSRRGPRGT